LSAPELEFDVGNLLVFDRQDVHESSLVRTQNSVQELFKHLFALPATQSQSGPVITLPQPTTPIPREKHIPTAKPETRWEKYAKDKGIQKRKRSRMVFDEGTQEWRPRFGMNRANNPLDDWVKDDKPEKMKEYGAEDPFILEKMMKRERMRKQKKQEVINSRRAGSAKAKLLPATLDITSNAPRRQKYSIERAVALAQKSTASMGKFDKRAPDEPKIRSKPKRIQSGENEKVQSVKIMQRVLKRKKSDVDVNKAANLHIRDQQQKHKQQKQQKGGSAKRRRKS